MLNRWCRGRRHPQILAGADQNAVKTKPAASYPLAQYHTRLGNTDQGLTWFQRAAEARDFGFVYVTADPIHHVFGNDPRYHNLAAYLNR